MDALEAISRRRSVKRLHEPAPGPAELELMFGAAMAAPDHRTHRPWRFFLLRGEAKDRFSEVLVDAYIHQCTRQGHEALPESVRNEREKLGRAPLVIVACAIFDEDPKAPRDEQLLAVGCAVQNLLIAATSLGFGTMWRSGEAARDPLVKAALGIRLSDEIVGFIYLGTDSERDPALPQRASSLEYVQEWS